MSIEGIMNAGARTTEAKARLLEAENDKRAAEAVALLRDVRIDLAALIPDPWNPSVEDWPVGNPADAKCLQDSYTRIRAFFVKTGETRP